VSPPSASVVPRADDGIVDQLLAGDEATFLSLVSAHHDAMFRVARGYVRSDDVAEEVVQETWMAVLHGLPRFEGRSSLKTWMFRILANRARTRARREVRTTPMSAVGVRGDDAPSFSPDRVDSSEGWNSPPPRWHEPLKHVQDQELGRLLAAAIATLPERQRRVLTLRDIEGRTSEEVRHAMALSESNQRVLLHRARTKVREAMAPYLDRPSDPPSPRVQPAVA